MLKTRIGSPRGDRSREARARAHETVKAVVTKETATQFGTLVHQAIAVGETPAQKI